MRFSEHHPVLGLAGNEGRPMVVKGMTRNGRTRRMDEGMKREKHESDMSRQAGIKHIQ
jgi:hypothetical protein